MKILIACTHYPVASGRYMKDAFIRLGHDVRTIGESTGSNIWGGKVDDRWAWESNGNLTTAWYDWTPDLVLVMDSAWAYHHPVYADVPHAVYGVDNHVRDYRQAGIARYFLAHNAVSLMDMSAEDVEWLPCAYDPAWFTPSPIPYNERVWDVALIGVPYQSRVEIVQAMREAGLKVIAANGLVYEDYRNTYWNARVSLCVSAAHDVAQRIFETAAMGCAVLSDPLPDLEALDAKGITTFDDAEGAVKAAAGLLKKPKMAETGQAWALSHSWDARARRIVEWWQETYAPKSKRKTVVLDD